MKHVSNKVLVGGFNLSKKYDRQIGSFSQVGMKIKNVWNHHQVILAFKTKTLCGRFCGDSVFDYYYITLQFWQNPTTQQWKLYSAEEMMIAKLQSCLMVYPQNINQCPLRTDHV